MAIPWFTKAIKQDPEFAHAYADMAISYFFRMLIFIDIDPLFDNIQDQPEFRKMLDDIETRFWEYHHEMKASLEEKGLL